MTPRNQKPPRRATGPGPQRARPVRGHPDHARTRDTRPDQPVDARLPLPTAPEKS
ncbi:hypothetical protein P3T26_000986 [Streptomyces sp. MAA16]|nr:hypothetical protein [Streptomyces sp. MAA16]